MGAELVERRTGHLARLLRHLQRASGGRRGRAGRRLRGGKLLLLPTRAATKPCQPAVHVSRPRDTRSRGEARTRGGWEAASCRELREEQRQSCPRQCATAPQRSARRPQQTTRASQQLSRCARSRHAAQGREERGAQNEVLRWRIASDRASFVRTGGTRLSSCRPPVRFASAAARRRAVCSHGRHRAAVRRRR